jgi:uncharacterized protein YjeT (DUF2065 family)
MPIRTSLPLDTLIDRWFAIGLLLFGLSHALYPAKWATAILPLRAHEHGGLWLGTFNLPIGLIVVLTHNIWVWDIPVIVTVMGWVMTLKGAIYLLLPGSQKLVMPEGTRMESGFRIVGIVAIALGALLAYDSFYRR